MLQLVTQFTPKDFNLASALKASNLTKNRNLDCVCTDTYRVALTPKPGVEGSDYINASFFPGEFDCIIMYYCRRAYSLIIVYL